MDPARFSVVPMQYPPGHESGLGGHAGFGLSGEGNVQVTGSILGTQHQMKRFSSREAAHAYMAENRLQPTSFT
jgi:hypothetical protein